MAGEVSADYQRDTTSTDRYSDYGPGEVVHLPDGRIAIRSDGDVRYDRVNSIPGATTTGSAGETMANLESQGYSWDGDSSPHWFYMDPPAEEESAPDYSAYFDALAKATDEANAIAREQLGIAQKSAALSEEQYNYWKTNFQPREQELIQKANRGIDANYAADIAGNRVGLAYDATRGATNRYYERLGIDPNDARLARIRADLELQRSADVVGARNNARTRTADTNRNMRLVVAGMGRGVPAQSLSAFGESAQSLAQAGQNKLTAATGLSSAIGTANAFNSAAHNASLQSALTAQGLTAQRDYNQSLINADREAMMYSALGQGIGTVAGYGLMSGMGRGQTQTPQMRTGNVGGWVGGG